jgi:hypothetical protein
VFTEVMHQMSGLQRLYRILKKLDIIDVFAYNGTEHPTILRNNVERMLDNVTTIPKQK